MEQLAYYCPFCSEAPETLNELKSHCIAIHSKSIESFANNIVIFSLLKVLKENPNELITQSTDICIPSDRALSQAKEESIMDMLHILEYERTHDHEIILQCPYCNCLPLCRSELFMHIKDIHHARYGASVDDVVGFSEFISILFEKANGCVCVYCGHKYPNYDVLHLHMRKKGHLRLHPRDNLWDRFFIANFTDLSRSWAQQQVEAKEKKMALRAQKRKYRAERMAEGKSYQDALQGFKAIGVEEEIKADKEEENDEEWEDIDGGEGIYEEQLTYCLFCLNSFNTPSKCLEHMSSVHLFDLIETQHKLGLDYYQGVKMVNYIRQSIQKHICPYCCLEHSTAGELRKHLDQTVEAAREMGLYRKEEKKEEEEEKEKESYGEEIEDSQEMKRDEKGKNLENDEKTKISLPKADKKHNSVSQRQTNSLSSSEDSWTLTNSPHSDFQSLDLTKTASEAGKNEQELTYPHFLMSCKRKNNFEEKKNCLKKDEMTSQQMKGEGKEEQKMDEKKVGLSCDRERNSENEEKENEEEKEDINYNEKQSHESQQEAEHKKRGEDKCAHSTESKQFEKKNLKRKGKTKLIDKEEVEEEEDFESERSFSPNFDVDDDEDSGEEERGGGERERGSGTGQERGKAKHKRKSRDKSSSDDNREDNEDDEDSKASLDRERENNTDISSDDESSQGEDKTAGKAGITQKNRANDLPVTTYDLAVAFPYDVPAPFPSPPQQMPYSSQFQSSSSSSSSSCAQSSNQQPAIPFLPSSLPSLQQEQFVPSFACQQAMPSVAMMQCYPTRYDSFNHSYHSDYYSSLPNSNIQPTLLSPTSAAVNSLPPQLKPFRNPTAQSLFQRLTAPLRAKKNHETKEKPTEQPLLGSKNTTISSVEDASSEVNQQKQLINSSSAFPTSNGTQEKNAHLLNSTTSQPAVHCSINPKNINWDNPSYLRPIIPGDLLLTQLEDINNCGEEEDEEIFE
ncbi:putative zinc finger, c2h2 type domain containing protein [Monocercomonoides exilis]|uniref:putative zinc finger, c2h2 type domain containing protein n=1 Tax=Monocercomonoides exilis TaxID=2049356 RepID=UPI0035593D0E|nr:putative zinc finger, c2h2 type domain containing protein [Monocercomonoides exilis]